MLRKFLLTASCVFTIIAFYNTAAFAENLFSPWLDSNVRDSLRNSDYNPSLKDDFYTHVNRDWLLNAKLKPGYASNSGFRELQDTLDANLRSLMTDETLHGHDAELVRNLYKLWLDWDARNSTDIGAIRKHISPVENIHSMQDLNQYFKSEECMLYGSDLANFVLGIDNEDSRYYNIEITATGLSLGDSAEYRNMTENGKRTKKMSDSVANYMLQKLGYSQSDAQKIIERAFAFETEISRFMMTLEEKESPDAIQIMYTNPVTFDDLRELSPVFPMVEIMQAQKVFSDRMNLGEKKWLAGLNEIYGESQLENIKAYLIRNIASRYMGLIDEASYRELQKISNERMGITNNRPDNEIATDFVHARLGVSVSKLYVAKYVSAETKSEIENLIRETIAFYETMLRDEDWLSTETREKAIEKLENLTPRAAYPDKWDDYSGLDIKSKSDGETLLSALEKLRKYSLKINYYDKLNTKIDREKWVGDVAVVNAYYSPSHNEIKIIAGILSGDFYRPDMSYEEKLGGIGMVIGHEISHAFDTNGAQFDKNGNIANWWTEQDYKIFKDRADKLINYLSSIKLNDGSNYNGSLVQTETIADMAGIKAMLGLAKKHENFDYDKFFRSYAKLWKEILTPERHDMLLKIDVHAMPYIRVNAIIQQYDEFQNCYGLISGDKMYLEQNQRVAVW